MLQIIGFGAHPDDCDIFMGGLAAKYVAARHRVRFVSITNGDAGHHEQGGARLAQRRRAESLEAGRRAGLDYIVLDNHDGSLLPHLHVREQIIRQIRDWRADAVFGHRTNDYHPDHRYAAMLVQDAAFMVTVPNVCSDTPPLNRNPVFFYYQDRFQKPVPFSPDIAVPIDDVFDVKMAMLDAHGSQLYEFLPWLYGKIDQVPDDAEGRRRWLDAEWGGEITAAVRAALVRWYGREHADRVRRAEAFEICEYGRQPDEAELRRLFPFVR
jgi:LmbE family N-acetylglucosaminyl deacetylase